MKNNDEITKIIKQVTKDDDAQIIGLNDTFKFECKQCGKCCMHRNDIIVNPFDVYNGAKYLGITTEEFVTNYLDVNLGAHSKMPMLLLKSDENTGYCPFLKFDVKSGGKFKCSINPAKPGACANHPIGVITARKKDSNDNTDFTFIKVGQCDNSKSDNDVLVKDWVQSYLDHEEEIHIAHEIQTYVADFFLPRDFFNLCQFVIDNFETCEAKEELRKTMGIVMANTIGHGYLDYDINKPFLEQAKRNKETLKVFYNKIKDLFEIIKKGCGIKEDESVDDFLEKHGVVL